MGLDDTQRSIVAAVGIALVVEPSPVRVLLGSALLWVAFVNPRL
jgi:hypothetical protein